MPRGGGIEITVTSPDLAQLYQAAKAADGNLQVQLRRGVRKAAKPIEDGVKAAASWSSRIPGAVRTKASFAARGASVRVEVDSGAAPEAAPINNKGRGGRFRHPVYGNRDNWVSQQARPFFREGVTAGIPAADAAMSRLMDDFAHQLGFH